MDVGEARGRGGVRILNLEERARLVGDSFTLKAQPGKGVAISGVFRFHKLGRGRPRSKGKIKCPHAATKNPSSR